MLRIIHLITCTAVCALYLPILLAAQQVVYFGPENLNAKVHYNFFLGIYKSYYDTLPNYPIKGAYSPTHYANTRFNTHPGIAIGVGVCNYIYIPTDEALIPGRQYKIRMTVKFGTAYAESAYFQSHFGVALVSKFPENNWGLWRLHFIPTRCKATEELNTVEFVFRPLCTSKYIVVGVFQGPTDDPADCFACLYGFELHDLSVEIWDDPSSRFVYICDAFEEAKLKTKYSATPVTDTVFFDSGSAVIREEYLSVLDSFPSKLRTKQDLITLYAYTDIEGSDNERLGAARNAAVRAALMSRGIDSSRILMVNYGESRASGRISQKDRKVEIEASRGKLFQKYYTEALQATTREDYGTANEKMKHWLNLVPPENAIYALFDCWGEGEKATLFRRDLVKNMRSKYYYKGKDLKFILDSLYCEDQKGRTLSLYRSMNRLPGFHLDCSSNLDTFKDSHNQSIIDQIYLEHGFPKVAEVGVRGNQTLPYMILHVQDTAFKKRYLPIVQRACEEQILMIRPPIIQTFVTKVRKSVDIRHTFVLARVD